MSPTEHYENGKNANETQKKSSLNWLNPICKIFLVQVYFKFLKMVLPSAIFNSEEMGSKM